MVAKSKTTETEAVTAPVEAAVEAPSLGIQDIQNTLKIIDFAAEQGAFKGWSTINQVQAVRAKIAAFVDYAQANSPPPEADAPAEATA